jgi:hypothetical protein
MNIYCQVLFLEALTGYGKMQERRHSGARALPVSLESWNTHQNKSNAWIVFMDSGPGSRWAVPE